jgi:hypothetical protein
MAKDPRENGLTERKTESWAYWGCLAALAVALGAFRYLPTLSRIQSYGLVSPLGSAQSVGDAAGEYRRMRRGAYDASTHVALAFLAEVAVASAIVGRCVWNPLSGYFGYEISLGAVTLAGVVVALLIFWNRWLCIEAFSSRFCSRVSPLSVLYVPIVALVYANVRGIMKLFGR